MIENKCGNDTCGDVECNIDGTGCAKYNTSDECDKRAA